MINIIEYVTIEDGSFINDIPVTKKVSGLEKILTAAKNITIEVMFNIFLEEPNIYLISAISFTSKNRVIYEAFLKEAYYLKHIGKFTKEAQDKITVELVTKLNIELDKVKWRDIINEKNN